MQIINANNIDVLKTGCVATVGFFDGVHIGHRHLINQLKNIATDQNLLSLVITFAVHPRKVLQEDFQPELLTTFNEKINQLESTGVDACIVLDFNTTISELSAYEFIDQILKKRYNVRTLLVGHDHRFGKNRVEGFSQYKQYGEKLKMKVIEGVQFSTKEFQFISSSVIRKALHDGYIDKANYLLSYNYNIEGSVVNGFKMGRKLGFPTANILVNDSYKLIPMLGVYAVFIVYNNSVMSGMMNIGIRPTIENGDKLSIEVHIFNFEGDIYNENLTIQFVKMIRQEQKFNSLDELILQLHKDKIQAQIFLEGTKKIRTL